MQLRYKLVSWLLKEKYVGNDELKKYHHDLRLYIKELEEENKRLRLSLRLPYKMYY